MKTKHNPFEGNESTFLSTDSRATQGKKGKKRKSTYSHKKGVKRYTSKRLQQPVDEDPDIAEEIRQNGEGNVHIIE